MIVDLYTMSTAHTNNPSEAIFSPTSHNEGGGAGQLAESSTLLTQDMLAHLGTKFADLPADRVAKIAEEIFKVQSTQKSRRKAKEIPIEDRCMARMWRTDLHDDEGNYVYGQPCQCSRRHKDGRFCIQHGKAHSECSQPLQFTNTGPKDYKRHGLFHGAVDEELPIHDAEGRLVIFWNDPKAKGWVQAQKTSGSYTEHPSWSSAGGNLWFGGTGEKHGTKKSDSSKTAKKKVKGSVASAIGVKQKRGLSPYFCFLAKHRAAIKSELEAAEAAAAADEGRSPNTVQIAPVTKEAGRRWNALKAQCEALDDDGCPVNPAAITEMAAYAASSAESKIQAAEANAAAEKAAAGSLDEQIAALQTLKAQGDTAASSAAPTSVPKSAFNKLKVKNESEAEKWQAAIDDGSLFDLDTPSLLTPAMLIAKNAE
jgi:hypothetical protein